MRVQTDWAALVPPQEWRLYQAGMAAVREAGVPFMIGGAFGLACYTGRWRNTKDIDFYIVPEDRERAIAALNAIGFGDYYSQLAYDRRWIYRSTRDGCIIDLIWAMANQRTQVDRTWVEDAPQVVLRGESLRVLPAEELLWCKLYVLQRDRCDWPDLINLLYAVGPHFDWERLLTRVGEDWPVLKALISIFTWAAPERAAALPDWLVDQLRAKDSPNPKADPEGQKRRINLIDSRPWFAADQPAEQPLKV